MIVVVILRNQDCAGVMIVVVCVSLWCVSL